MRCLRANEAPGTLIEAELTAPMLLSVIRKIEERGALDVAHRVLSTARNVLAYAVACGKAERNCALDLKGALQPHGLGLRSPSDAPIYGHVHRRH